MSNHAHQKKKSYPASQTQDMTSNENKIAFILWTAWHLAKHSEKLKTEKEKKCVDVLLEYSTSSLRMDTSCLLLKYINSVLILHLQLWKQRHLHISYSHYTKK